MRKDIKWVALAVMAACGATGCSPADGPDALTETIGDTTIVRTLSGSVWGAEATLVPEVSIGELDGPEEYLFGSVYSIAVDGDGRFFVLDGQAQQIRVYDPEGVHVETVARRGEGPGELRNAFSVAVLPDGRVLAHEPADMLVKVVGPDPADRVRWQYPQGAVVLPVKPLRTDVSGRILVTAAGTTPSGDFTQYVIVMGLEGQRLDSLAPPGSGFAPPSLEVRLPFPMGGRSTASIAVPLTPRHHWTPHPSGHFVTGISTRYRFELGHDDGVLRVERAYDPVATSQAERDYHQELVTERLRRTQPDWSWNGPAVPDTKPPFRGLVAGRDGRIWMQLWTEARPVVNEDHDPDNPRSEPVTWVSPVRYDVFEPDGVYLGALATPDGFLVSPAEPIFDGENVWAVTQDALGVQRVVRYRIVIDDG